MKKKKTKSKTFNRDTTPKLPQNIIPVGERVFEDKNIYIHQKVYEQIHKFSANKTENEHGGILLGRVLNELGKENTIIEGFIEAKYNSATPTTLTFTHETWDYFHTEIDRKYNGKKIVGWIHTHPNFGIFLSENDRFIHQNFFTDSNQVAYVVDPIQLEEGFFFWIDGKLERCAGFYLFDKNGVKIKQKPWSAEDVENEDTIINQSKARPITTVALILIIILNLFVMTHQSRKIRMLEKKVEDQELVLRYRFGVEVSDMADNIRMQSEMHWQSKKNQKKYEKKNKRQEEDKTAEEQKDVEQKTEENGGNM